MIVFRVNGRDSYELASQFNNTPPPAETRVEPIYQEFEYQGMDVLLEAELNTGEGKLYQEVELPKRPYNDVEAERANKLSILPNYEAWCRLIQFPKNGGRPKLVEQRIETELLKDEFGEELKPDPEIAKFIREKYREDATPRIEIEKDIEKRTMGEITLNEKPIQTFQYKKD
jgi:hypothetical protein